MKPSTTQLRHLSPAIGKILMALAFASALGAVSIAPALARDNDNYRHDKGWHKGERHHERNYYHDRRDPYYYSAPVYTPPPVYYAPQPSPGISLFFPLDFRH